MTRKSQSLVVNSVRLYLTLIKRADKIVETHGGITQLVECLLCKQKVAGSNPVTSTKGLHRPPSGAGIKH